jgi:alcohol dehydrogenase (cytochrome c)
MRDILRSSAGALFLITALGAQTGPFTQDQVTRGERIYRTSCAGCHGSQLSDGAAPPLAGFGFLEKWAQRPVNAYLTTVRTMPPGGGGSLPDEDYAAVTAWLLDRLGHSAGSVSLAWRSKEAVNTLVQPPPGAARKSTPAPPFIKGSGAAQKGAGPTQQELNAAYTSKRDWLYHTHDYSGTRYAAIAQMTPANISKLRVECAFQFGEQGSFQTGPVVYEGRMYLTGARTTVAIDAKDCSLLWRHQWAPRAREVWFANRGVAIKDGYLVRGTIDGYLLAISAVTGDLIWARKAADTSVGETFTMAPMVFEDRVLIGPAGSENAVSGWVGAFRLADGEPIWRFKTVPGADEPGSETWQNPKSIKLGGGATWTPFSFDPEKGELFVAVTNPAPDFPAHLRPGDNLYTNSLVALDVRNGKLLWHKQLVPNDSHDWDLTQVSPLFKAVVNGRDASLVATVGKDGILRTLDRETHKAIYQTPVTTIENYDIPVTNKGVHACPGVLGGVEWNGPAYNPVTRMLYTPAVDWCGTFKAAEDDAVTYVAGANYLGGTYRFDKTSQGWVTATDAVTGEVRWRYRSEQPVVGAVTTTSGGLVFTGELTGHFTALDARTGKLLHRFQTGGPIGGGLVTYELGNRQYVAVASGSPSRFWVSKQTGSPTVFVFALPE